MIRRSGLLLTIACTVFHPASASAQDSTLHRVRLPELWGAHAVGVRTAVVIDSSRSVRVGEREMPRPLLVRTWYPAEDIGGPARRYMPSPVAEAWRSTLPVPSGWETQVETNAVADVPFVAATAGRQRFPVLLFSHGRSYPVENYQELLEQLASRGWVVAAISHPGEEALTLLPDGTEIPYMGPTWDDEADRGEVLMGVVDELVLDAARVIDWLERRNADPEDLFGGRLALETGTGYFGHSLGGAAAAWTLRRDPRVVAAASWEGQVYREEDQPLRPGGPLLYIVGGANRAELAGRQFRGEGSDRPVYEVVLNGAWHISVGDLLRIYPSYAPRDWKERHRREMTAGRANQITVDLLHAFFGRHLKGEPAPLLEPDTPGEDWNETNYPEVELRMNLGGDGYWNAASGP